MDNQLPRLGYRGRYPAWSNMKSCFIAIVLFVLVAGCNGTSPDSSHPASEPLADTAQSEDQNAEPRRQMTTLHDDSAIEKLASYNITETTTNAKQLFDIPHLEVVPAGETKSRESVFTTLGLNGDQIDNLEYDMSGRVLFLSWRISPSYFLSCMTGYLREFSDDEIDRMLSRKLDDDDALLDKMSDPDRMIYGVRITSQRMR